MRARIASRCGPIRGASQMIVTSTWAIRPPACSTRSRACSRKSDGGGAAPLRVRRREMVADVAGAERAEDRVGQRVEDDVGVAMAREAPVVRDTDAAEPELVGRRRRRGRRSRSRRAGRAAPPRRGGNRPRRSASRAPDRLRRSATVRPAARAIWASSVASPPVQAAWARRIASKRKACGVCTRIRSSRGTLRQASVGPRQRVDRRAGRGRRRRASSSAVEQPVDHRAGQEGAGGVVDQHALDIAAAPAPRGRCAPTAAGSRRR